MIAASSFATWATLNPLANHLWQSTLCAVLVGLLTLVLRGNRAQVRYSLWLIAIVKFLVPFSLLMGMVSHLGVRPAPARLQSGLSVTASAITEPFNLPIVPTAGVESTSRAAVGDPIPPILLATWLCGCIVVLCCWWMRWWRITAEVHAAGPMQEGRELEALRRFRSKTGIESRIILVPSPTLQEPGVLGIRRPVLLLPVGISERLADDQLEAIIGHEVCHARRRDNLASAIQMAVEAAFWFYPLVWWMGARLTDERERACDEEVLRLGCKPQVYAESILRVCEFYLESPLVCIAGVTGSNLKKRMERIMNHRIPKKLGLGKKLLIAAAGTALLVVLMAASTQFRDEFAGKLGPGWQWIDPQGDSRMSLDERGGFLRITVTGYHDLWPANRTYNAPRLMREVQGDFTVETKIDGPNRWCGGLLVWKDQNNYVRLERGIHFKNEVYFGGANNGEFLPLARDYAAGD
ncbi:MAG: hypothetical protein EHM65_04670, partial [Acidobacteriales bacterium]